MEVNEDDVAVQIENDGRKKNCLFHEIKIFCFLGLYQSILNPSKTITNHSLTIAEQVKKLGEGIEVLSNRLHQQILEKHDDLLQQANHANKLETILNTMNIHVQNVMANADRLKSQVHCWG